MRFPLTLVLVLVLIAGACGRDDGVEPPATTTPSTTIPSTTTTITSTTTTTPGLLTIMPIGDSITQGSAGWRTYRCALDGKLDDAGVAFDFVGGLSAPNDGGTYGCPDPFDQDHEGRWGQRVDEVTDAVTASVQALQPDVALIHLGTNDILQAQDTSETASELESLITGLQAVSPDITVLVAQIIPCGLGPGCTTSVQALNGSIGSFANLSTARSAVIVVDMETNYSPSDLRDRVHPTDRGDEIIASRWIAALQDAGLL